MKFIKKGLLKCFYFVRSSVLRCFSFISTRSFLKILSHFMMVFLLVFACPLLSYFSFTSSASAMDIVGTWDHYWQHYDCANPPFLFNGSWHRGEFAYGNAGSTDLQSILTCKREDFKVKQNDIYVIDVYVEGGMIASLYPYNQMHLLQTETIAHVEGVTQLRFYILATVSGEFEIPLNATFRSAGESTHVGVWVSTIVGYRSISGNGMETTEKTLKEISSKVDQTNANLEKVTSTIQGTAKDQLDESKRQTDAINNQTKQEQDQYDQEKQEESDRENAGKEDGNKLLGIFNIALMNPFDAIFEMFNPGGCVSIPTISSWVHSKDSTYCSWWPQSVRSVLTPVFSIASVMLLFGFVIHWLRGNDLNGKVYVDG